MHCSYIGWATPCLVSLRYGLLRCQHFILRWSLHLSAYKEDYSTNVCGQTSIVLLFDVTTIFDVASMLVGFTVLTNFTDCHKPIL